MKTSLRKGKKTLRGVKIILSNMLKALRNLFFVVLCIVPICLGTFAGYQIFGFIGLVVGFVITITFVLVTISTT